VFGDGAAFCTAAIRTALQGRQFTTSQSAIGYWAYTTNANSLEIKQVACGLDSTILHTSLLFSSRRNEKFRNYKANKIANEMQKKKKRRTKDVGLHGLSRTDDVNLNRNYLSRKP
jgi:hypothetical protein